MRRRPEPRPVADAMAALVDRLEPVSTLAAVQRVWPDVVGPAIAAQATPTSERAGVLAVTCSSAVWAQELDLMGPDLTARLNAALGSDLVSGLRCSSAPRRGWDER